MSTVLRRYEELLVRLHREMRAGRGESEQANDLREQMMPAWQQLTADERAVADELSEDLFVIEGDFLPHARDESDTTEALNADIASAFKRGDYRRTLGLLRKLPIEADAGPRVRLLSLAWDRLGFHRAAAALYDHSNELRPDPITQTLALRALLQASAVEDAKARIADIVSNPNAPSALTLFAATVLSELDVLTHEDSARDALIIQLVERGLKFGTQLPPLLQSSALIASAYAHQRAGDVEQARRALDNAVLVGDNDIPLVARGLMLLAQHRPEDAARDFFEATKLGTSILAPYQFFVHHALSRGDFANAIKVSDRGAAKAPSGPLRAQFYEWSAIAAAKLGLPRLSVLNRFDLAAAEDPTQDRIRSNRAWYELHTEEAFRIDEAFDEAQAHEALRPLLFPRAA